MSQNMRQNKNGFTLSEMLMTVLIISLVIVILGGGVFVVKNAYEKVTAKAEAQTILSTAVTKITDEFRYATTSEDTANAPYEFTSGISRNLIWFENGDKDTNNDIKTGILMCRGEGETDRIQLLTDQTMAENLIPEIGYSFDKDTRVFHATIDVKKDGKTFASQEIYIKPVNN